MADSRSCSIVKNLQEIEPGDHLCIIYDTDEEHRKVITPYLRCGLEKNQKVFYIVDAREADQILEYFVDEGVDPKPYLKKGQLCIYGVKDSYMRDGIFDPARMISLLESETKRAVQEGYSALRVTGEMSWALKGLPGSERLFEYETKLNNFFPGSKSLAICQYDRRRFSADVLLNVLKTHPIAVLGTELYDNFYFVSPDVMLSPDPSKGILDNWIESLKERKQAEKELANAYAGLEDKVRERTNELQERIKELERFRKATVEREFRMKELRDEIERLKAEKN